MFCFAAKPVQLKIGFGCLEPGFLAITRALYQTATLPLRASNEVLSRLHAAAVASTLSSAFLLICSIHLAKLWDIVKQRATEFISCIILASITCFGFISNPALIFSGLILFLFTPRGWKALISTES